MSSQIWRWVERVVRPLLSGLFGLMCLFSLATAHALTPEDALLFADGDTSERIEVMGRLAASNEQRAEALIRAMAREEVKLRGEQVLIVKDGLALDAVTGESVLNP